MSRPSQAAVSRPSEAAPRRGRRPRRRRETGLLVVMAAAAAARIVWVAIVHAQPVSDYLFYYRSAVNIASGQGYAIMDHPTAFFPVGYPAFLGAWFKVAGTSVVAIQISGILLWTISAGLACLLGTRIGGRTAGLIAGLIVALYPDYIIYSGLAASENLVVPLLLFVAMVLASVPRERFTPGRAAVAGVGLGLAILVRSTVLPLPVVLGAYLVVRDRNALRSALVLIAVSALVVAPWVLRNWSVMGGPVVSTNGGYTLWMGLNTGATGGPIVKGEREYWPLDSERTELDDNSEHTWQAVGFLLRHPIKTVSLVPAKATYLFRWTPGTLVSSRAQPPPNGSFDRTHSRELGGSESALLTWLLDNRWRLVLVHTVYLLLGFTGLVVALLRRRPGSEWIALIFLFWVAYHITLIHGQSRFLISISPFLAPFIGYLAVATAQAVVPGRIKERHAGRTAGRPAGRGRRMPSSETAVSRPRRR